MASSPFSAMVALIGGGAGPPIFSREIRVHLGATARGIVRAAAIRDLRAELGTGEPPGFRDGSDEVDRLLIDAMKPRLRSRD